MEILADRAIAGADLAQPLDAIFVNAPLRDYSLRPRTNDFTLPVLGMGYIATYAASRGFNVGVIDAEALGLASTRPSRSSTRRRHGGQALTCWHRRMRSARESRLAWT